MKKMMILIFVLMLYGCSAKNMQPDFTMTTTELSTLFEENEIQASLTYEDKLIRVNGIVKYISGDKNQVSITLYPYLNIVITTNIEDTVDIQEFSSITVQGVLSRTYDYTSLQDCVIIEHVQNSPVDYTMTYDDFNLEHEEDEQQATAKYLYKTIQLTGYVLTNTDYVTMCKNNSYCYNAISIYFRNNDDLSTITDKSTITIKGVYAEFDSFLSGKYIFGDCIIIT